MFPVKSESSIHLLKTEENEENDLHLILNHSKDLISRHSKNGLFLYVSPSITTLLGYSQQELYQKNIISYCHPAEKAELKVQFQANTENWKERIRFRIRKKDGTYLWLETNFSNSSDGGEFLCISRDITEHITSIEEIYELQQQFHLLLESSKDTIGMISETGEWTYINNKGSLLFGADSHNDLIGTSLFQYLSSTDQRILADFLSMNQYINFEMNLYRPDGLSKKADIQLIPTNHKGRKFFQIIIRDITGQRETEEQLLNAEKLSIVGQLAAGIAHEIRNPLTAIKGFTQFLNEGHSNKYADVILNELVRIEGIVNDLLILAKPQSNKVNKVNIINLIKSVVILMNSQAAISNIKIEEYHQSSDVILDCEGDKIKQLLINLIRNSIEAMPSGGIITITTREENQFLELKIQDEGIGIPSEYLTRLGEPFFSTKEKGTGLGIMISNNIVKSHGGTMHITSKLKEGTTVKIKLPIALEDE